MAHRLHTLHAMCPTGIAVQVPVINCVCGSNRRVNPPGRLPGCNFERDFMQVSSVSGGYGYAMAASSMQGPPPPPPQAKKFSEVDSNSDGSITQDELSAILGSNGSNGAPSVADIFSKVDTDGSGGISSDEWDTFQQNIQQMPPPPPPPTDFSSVDTDGDGSISKSELNSAMPKPVSGDSSDSSDDSEDSQLFSDIDTDGDGKISSAEWSAFQQKMQATMPGGTQSTDNEQRFAATLQSMVSKLYKTADSDSNGQLSQAEMTAWLESAGYNSVSFAA
jgi:Ca2+-binding EF-hand superfamily protein